jgi:hypothetical protein
MANVISLSMRASMLDGVEAFMLLGSGTAKLRILQFNTTLVEFDLSAAPFGSASADGIVLADAPISGTASNGGRATRFQLINQNGVVGLTGDVGTDGDSSLRVPSLTVTDGDTQYLNALVLRMGSNGELTVEGSLTLQ